MGLSALSDPERPPRIPEATPGATMVTREGRRSSTPTDLTQVNTTPMAGPLRKLINQDDGWATLEPTPPPCLIAQPAINPLMGNLDHRRAV